MRTMTMMAALGAVALAGCSGSDTTNGTTATGNMTAADDASGNMAAENGAVGEAVATADLRTADGAAAGTATASQTGEGVRIVLAGTGLPAGVHGAHVHTTGKCEGPKFETAGGHWNPGTMKHGLENPAGPHAGDMPNVEVAADGAGSLTYTLPGGTFDGLFDADGSAFIIHEGPDDMKTDPAGNSGGRMACGVFTRA